jgi:hypothetical protein
MPLPPIIFEETFSNNSNNWDVSENALQGSSVITGIVDEQYVVEWECNSPPFGSFITTPDPRSRPVFTSSYEFEISVDVESRTNHYRIGLFFQVQPDFEGWNSFRIEDTGRWYFRELQGELDNSLEGVMAEPIDFADGGIHTMGIRVDGTEYTFLADGQVVTTVTGETITQGSIELYAACNPLDDKAYVRAAFDDLIVRSWE